MQIFSSWNLYMGYTYANGWMANIRTVLHDSGHLDDTRHDVRVKFLLSCHTSSLTAGVGKSPYLSSLCSLERIPWLICMYVTTHSSVSNTCFTLLWKSRTLIVVVIFLAIGRHNDHNRLSSVSAELSNYPSFEYLPQIYKVCTLSMSTCDILRIRRIFLPQ